MEIMKTEYIVRNKLTGQVYIDNARTFGEAVTASVNIHGSNLEMIRTTTEVIKHYEKGKNNKIDGSRL